MKVVSVEDREVVILHVDGEFCALDNQCPHRGGPLGGGQIEGCAVVCPWHNWKWHAKTGRAVWPEVDWRATRYPVKVENGWLFIRVR